MSERVVRSRTERFRGYRAVLEARSPDTPVERLDVLASDEIRPVRLWTARNRNTSLVALDRLAQDPDDSVRYNALLNSQLPASTLRWLAGQEAKEPNGHWFLVRRYVVHHPNTPSSLRAELTALGACTCATGYCGGSSAFPTKPRSTDPVR